MNKLCDQYWNNLDRPEPSPRLRWKSFYEWYRLASRHPHFQIAALDLVIGTAFPELYDWAVLVETPEPVPLVQLPKAIWIKRLEILRRKKMMRKIRIPFQLKKAIFGN